MISFYNSSSAIHECACFLLDIILLYTHYHFTRAKYKKLVVVYRCIEQKWQAG